MARIRTIKPAFFSSLSNADLPVGTRLTWIGLWTYVDDKGRGVDDARLVKAAVWPLDDSYTTKKVEADLVKLEKAGKIGRYIHDGQRYLAVVKWRDHQRIDKPQRSTLPPAPWEPKSGNDPGTGQEDSGNVPGTPPPDDGNAPGTMPPKDGGEVEGNGSGREGKGKEGRSHSSVLNHDGAGEQVGKGEEDLETSEPPMPSVAPEVADHEKLLPLADRMAEALWPNRPRRRAESVVVVRKCLTVADPTIVDECIGAMIAADDKPHSPNYLVTTVKNRLVGMGAYAPDDAALAVLGGRS
jgi:hypothetical protein